jgi:hypothetical protein
LENKRIWAMVGVVYMVIMVLLMTYWIATTTLLTGITGIMLTPACAGLAVQCFNSRWKCLHQENARGNPTVFLLLGVACSAGAGYTLLTGIAQLIRQLP